MHDLCTIVGMKENIVEDVHIFVNKIVPNPEILFAAGKEMRRIVTETCSTLFLEKNLVLILLDPERAFLAEMADRFESLRDRINVVIYLTAAIPDLSDPIWGQVTVMEKGKDKRFKDKVLALLKKHDKVMTDKAFKLLRERIKDESTLEAELLKLINFVGNRKEIKSGDVASIVTEIHDENLLSFFETIVQKDKKETLSLFENLLQSGLNILAVQGFLVKQARLMLHAKDMEEIFKTSSEYPAFSKTFTKWKEDMELEPLEKKLFLPYQKPFYAYKLSRTSQKFERKDLLFFFSMLLSLDMKIKSGTKNDRIYLEHGLLGA